MRDAHYPRPGRYYDGPPASMPLSEAILLGIGLRPQANGTWGQRDEKTGYFLTTCALAAALDAVGILGQFEHGIYGAVEIHYVFPVLYKPTSCPVCSVPWDLATIIAHVTDDHLWSRQQVAHFVKGIEDAAKTSTAMETATYANRT